MADGDWKLRVNKKESVRGKPEEEEDRDDTSSLAPEPEPVVEPVPETSAPPDLNPAMPHLENDDLDEIDLLLLDLDDKKEEADDESTGLVTQFQEFNILRPDYPSRYTGPDSPSTSPPSSPEYWPPYRPCHPPASSFLRYLKKRQDRDTSPPSRIPGQSRRRTRMRGGESPSISFSELLEAMGPKTGPSVAATATKHEMVGAGVRSTERKGGIDNGSGLQVETGSMGSSSGIESESVDTGDDRKDKNTAAGGFGISEGRNIAVEQSHAETGTVGSSGIESGSVDVDSDDRNDNNINTNATANLAQDDPTIPTVHAISPEEHVPSCCRSGNPIHECLLSQRYIQGPEEFVKRTPRLNRDILDMDQPLFDIVHAEIVKPPYKLIRKRVPTKPNPWTVVTEIIGGVPRLVKIARGGPNLTSRGGGRRAFTLGRAYKEGAIKDQRIIKFPTRPVIPRRRWKAEAQKRPRPVVLPPPEEMAHHRTAWRRQEGVKVKFHQRY